MMHLKNVKLILPVFLETKGLLFMMHRKDMSFYVKDSFTYII